MIGLDGDDLTIVPRRGDAPAASDLIDADLLESMAHQHIIAARDDMVAQVNSALAAVTLSPRLVDHDGLDWHVHALADDRPLPERILVETAMALIDVIRAHEGSRITVCADADCQAVALDLSRNRSKRYCSTTCANRNAVAAYRARRAAG